MPSQTPLPVPGPHQAEPALVPLPSPPGVPAVEVPVEAARPEWHGGALPPAPGLASGPDVTSLLKGLQRRWWVALFLGLLLAGGAATGAWYLLDPPYTAVAEVHIDAVPKWLLTRGLDTSGDRNEFINYERWQAALMKSREILSSARARDDVKNLPLVREQPDSLEFLDEQVTIDYKDGDERLAIKMQGKDPEAQKAIVKAIREEYMEKVVKKEQAGREAKRSELQAVVEDTRKHLNEHNTTLHKLAKERGVTPNGGLAMTLIDLRTQLREKQRDLSSVENALTKVQARLKTFEEEAKNVKVRPPSEDELAQALDADPIGHDLVNRQARLRARVKGYEESRVDPNEYGLRRARETLADIEQALKARLAQLRKALGEGQREKVRSEIEAELKAMRVQIAELELTRSPLAQQVKDLEGDKGVVGESSVELEQLNSEVTEERNRLNKYENDLAALEIELRPGVPKRVTEFQEAMLLKRDQKKQILATALGPVAVLLLTCFAVGWWESRARRIHTAEEVANGLGMRVVGAIPPLPNAARLAAAGEGHQDVHVHSLLESIDSIRTVLLRDAHVDATRVIMVTSAVGGEGKTTLASHLASSLARAGRRTLLIDCDLRRPSAHQLFELPLQPGFSEAVMGEVHIAEATLATTVDGLWMIPAGQWDREVLQALARDGLEKVFDKLKNEYDFIVIDSHPVLPATDSLLIGQHVDAVILSVMRSVSQAPKVYAAYQRLATLGIRIFGAVVNGLPEDDVYSGGYQYTTPAAR
jgi:succinoglycan biosynthesis transport protein ExoP